MECIAEKEKTHFFRAKFMSRVLEMCTKEWKDNNETILGRKLQTHVKIVFKKSAVEARREGRPDAPMRPYEEKHPCDAQSSTYQKIERSEVSTTS